MKKIQIGHDGVAVLQSGALVYVDTVENLDKDAGAVLGLTPGLIYHQGGAHCVIDASGAQLASVDGAAYLDSLLGDIAALIAARDARQAAALSAMMDALPVDQKRAVEYVKQGATVEALVVALWEKVIEGRPAAADALQEKRVAVKAAVK